MTFPTWPVPTESIRHSATPGGAQDLARLAADAVVFDSNATVELGPNGFVATLVYSMPGHPTRRGVAHIRLDWQPRENRA